MVAGKCVFRLDIRVDVCSLVHRGNSQDWARKYKQKYEVKGLLEEVMSDQANTDGFKNLSGWCKMAQGQEKRVARGYAMGQACSKPIHAHLLYDSQQIQNFRPLIVPFLLCS